MSPHQAQGARGPQSGVRPQNLLNLTPTGRVRGQRREGDWEVAVPSFLGLMFSHTHQVEITVLLRQSFEWVCISPVSSDSNYGQLGMQVLED